MKIDTLIAILKTQRILHGGDADVVFSLGNDELGLHRHLSQLDVVDKWSDGPDLPVHTVVLGTPKAEPA